jgi:hypothetical protein
VDTARNRNIAAAIADAVGNFNLSECTIRSNPSSSSFLWHEFIHDFYGSIMISNK